MKHFILAALLVFGLAGQAYAYGPYIGFSISTGVPLPPPPPPPPVYYGYPAPPPVYYPGYVYNRPVPPPNYYRHRHHHRNWD